MTHAVNSISAGTNEQSASASYMYDAHRADHGQNPRARPRYVETVAQIRRQMLYPI